MSWFWEIWSFDGRISRSQWWIGTLLIFAWVVMWFVLGVFAQASIFLLAYVPALLWGFASDAKRWHDLDKSGWWTLIALIPLIGGIWMLCECGFQRGTDGPNRYGYPPGWDNGKGPTYRNPFHHCEGQRSHTNSESGPWQSVGNAARPGAVTVPRIREKLTRPISATT